MRIDKLVSLWGSYRQTTVDVTIDPSDNMFPASDTRSHEQRLREYIAVGESGARVVFAVLASSTTEDVTRVLDFACGGGRGARHLRAMFPTAEMYFSDINSRRAEFCASQFRGTAVPSNRDFSQLQLPENLDLIWVGSLFTHIDYQRMENLYDSLWHSLSPRGTLIATFHGKHLIGIQPKMKFIKQDSWDRILRQCNDSGVGYESYGLEHLGDIGVSLISIERVVALGERHSDSRLVNYTAVGWANLQDVAAWSKVPV